MMILKYCDDTLSSQQDEMTPVSKNLAIFISISFILCQSIRDTVEILHILLSISSRRLKGLVARERVYMMLC